MRILDIHTHHLSKNAIVSTNLTDILYDGYFYSAGIHPWHINNIKEEYSNRLETLCRDPHIVAIGECGLDSLTDVPMQIQEYIFRQHIKISEHLAKPMIIHCVRAHERLLAIRNEIHPLQPWIIHGFRQKPSVASRLLNAGIYLSFGLHFNPETVRIVPKEKLFIETDDDSTATIKSVATAIANIRNISFENMLENILKNTSHIFGKTKLI